MDRIFHESCIEYLMSITIRYNFACMYVGIMTLYDCCCMARGYWSYCRVVYVLWCHSVIHIHIYIVFIKGLAKFLETNFFSLVTKFVYLKLCSFYTICVFLIVLFSFHFNYILRLISVQDINYISNYLFIQIH